MNNLTTGHKHYIFGTTLKEVEQARDNELRFGKVPGHYTGSIGPVYKQREDTWKIAMLYTFSHRKE